MDLGGDTPAATAAQHAWFQSAPVPMHSMGPDGLLIAVNDEWTAFTGHPRERAIGHSFAEFLDAASAQRYREAAVPEMIGTVPAGDVRSVEYRLVRGDGEIADIVLTARAMRDPANGRFIRSLSVISDITARNRAEAALRQAQKLDALGSLTGGVAHDFNNLLMVVLASLGMLEKRLPPGDTRAARLLQTALQGVDRGAALTRRLLAFARQQDLAPRPVRPAELFDGLDEMLSRALGPRVRIERDVPPDGWLLHADWNQLELALLNLAINARDAMPDGGMLRIATRDQPVAGGASAFFPDAAAPALAPGDYVVIALADTGSGMDEATLARAAEPFFTTKGTGRGTGMGLPMVHGFAAQSGGALLLSSRPGSGTVAELWLPRAPDGVGQPAAEAVPKAMGRQRALRVLLVDDDPLVRAGTAAMLEDLGHVVAAQAASGAEALAALPALGSLDLLMTDQAMPGMTGVQLAQAVQTQRPGLPVLLASGYAELGDSDDPRWPRLPKPYSQTALAAALAAFAAAGE